MNIYYCFVVLTNFQETLLILMEIRGHIYASLMSLFPKEDRLSDENLLFTITNHLHILICNFMEEWKRFESYAKINKNVITTLKVASPAIKRIRRWKDLRLFRSQLLAHSHRDKNNRYIPWEPIYLFQYNSPTSYAEIILLGHCALCAIKAVNILHKCDALLKTNNKSLFLPETLRQGIRSLKDLDKERSNIEQQIDNNIKNASLVQTV